MEDRRKFKKYVKKAQDLINGLTEYITCAEENVEKGYIMGACEFARLIEFDVSRLPGAYKTLKKEADNLIAELRTIKKELNIRGITEYTKLTADGSLVTVKARGGSDLDYWGMIYEDIDKYGKNNGIEYR